MAHTHDVYDMENHFEINGSSRFIKETSETKLVVVQGDHKSEVLTFKMPRYIDGHDMTLCNKIRIHYINLNTKTNNKSADVYEVTDLTLCEECEDVLTFTWTIEAPATKYSGTLSFLVKFECTEGENVLYQWNTAKYVSVNVLAGIDNSEEFVEKYSNVLEEWYNELTRGADSIEELNQQALAEIELAKEDAKEDIQGKADATMAEMNQFSSNAYNSFKNNVDAKAKQTLASIPEDYSALDAEVKNIRVGVDETVHPSAGEAVRKQLSELYAITENSYNLFDKSKEVDGYLGGTGAINSADGFKTSDFIKVNANVEYFLVQFYTDSLGSTSQEFIATYDDNKENGNRVYIGNGYVISDEEGNKIKYASITPTENGYMRFTYKTAISFTCMVTEGELKTEYKEYGTKEIKVDENLISKLPFIPKNDMIIVSKDGNGNGNGNYSTVTEAVSNASNGATIIIYPGVYDGEQINAKGKNLSIIGLDKTKCIIQNSNNWYGFDPLTMTDGHLKNVTIIANASDDYVFDENKSECYCMHIDTDGANSELLVEDCNFISYHWACLGIGLQENQKITIKNCEMINMQSDSSRRRKALLFHDRQVNSDCAGQLLIIDNCRLKSHAGKTINFQAVGGGSIPMEIRLYNNVFYDTQNGTDCLDGNFARTGQYLDANERLLLSGDSFGNNIADFNS